MKTKEEMLGLIEEEAKYLEAHSEFSFEDAKDALERGIRHYRDCGEDEDSAWEHSRELVATAVYPARDSGFGLVGMVNYMLFSLQHRVQAGFGL